MIAKDKKQNISNIKTFIIRFYRKVHRFFGKSKVSKITFAANSK